MNDSPAAAVSRPLHILLVTHGFPPQSVGGVEQHVHGLAHALVAAGHRVSIYSRTSGNGAEGELREEQSAPFRLTRVVYNYRDVRSLADLYRSELLDRAFAAYRATLDPVDVAHAHHFTGLSVGVLHQLADAGVPTAVTLHDYWMLCPRGQMWHHRGEVCAAVEPVRCADCLQQSFGGLLGSEPVATVATHHQSAVAALRRATTLIAPSARAVPPFARAGLDAARVRVVANGVDTEHLERVPPLARRPRGQPLRVGFLGTLIPSKGLDVLVDAVQQLPGGTIQLAIHGNAVPYHGDHSFLTKVFSRLRAGDQVAYHGPYSTADLPAILGPLDCVVAPALWEEAFGLTVREALSAGRAAVVSRIGGLQDAVRDEVDGLLFSPGDRAGLARLLTRLVAEPDLAARLGAAGRKQPRGFTAMAEELVGVYRSIAGSPRLVAAN